MTYTTLNIITAVGIIVINAWGYVRRTRRIERELREALEDTQIKLRIEQDSLQFAWDIIAAINDEDAERRHEIDLRD